MISVAYSDMLVAQQYIKANETTFVSRACTGPDRKVLVYFRHFVD